MEDTRVRRRLVQSTLFPHRDGSVKEAVNCNGNGEKQVEEEDCCGGSSKKKTESKRKANSRSKKASPASSQKVTENGKETPSKQVDDRDSLIIVDGRSTPQKRKRRDISTPRKERVNSTPNKKMKSGARELFCGQIPFDLTVDEQPLQTIPDLRLEAKLRAEENSRIFAGRQIHPFFTSRKGGKVSQDSTDTESNWFSFEKKEKCISFNPIHVFENVEDDHTTLDWGHWIFSERSDVGGLGCSPVYEGSVDSLNFDNLLSVSHLTRASLYQNSDQRPIPKREISMRLPGQPECSLPISPLSLSNKTVICSEQKDSDMLPKDTENVLATSVDLMLLGNKTENLNSFDGRSCGENLASELEDKLLQERIMSHYHTCHSQPENSLWTDKYQPQNAKQVWDSDSRVIQVYVCESSLKDLSLDLYFTKKICGNCESVNFLSKWLHLWHKRGSLTSRSRSTEDKSVARDIDHDYQQSDSDSDTVDDEESLKNVLLVTGPVGSGKSAAIYACARDQGFQVIEINASDWRNGALIKQKFGEAVESHWLQRTVENGPNSDNKPMSKFFTAVKAERHCSDIEAIELIDLSDKKDSEDASVWLKTSVCGEDITSSYQNDIKNLILFEDVDATLCEDHGFITTIQQLGETAKRPMILTSNSENPVLPKNLDRSELSFSLPSHEELLGLVYMICAAEKTKIHPCLVERFIDYCEGDIRKTIMLLQFWCQGQTVRRGTELCKSYRPVPFDLDAGHHILPKVIPWGYPSQLSELVEEQLVESLILMEKIHGLEETNNSEGLYDCLVRTQDGESDPMEAKKEAMLKLHNFQDEVECAQIKGSCELSDSSGSPVAFARKNRRKNTAVLSSDSEDDLCGDSITPVSAGLLDINVELLDLNSFPASHCVSTDLCYHTTEQIYQSKIGKLEEDCCRLPERVDYLQTDDTCRAPDKSFVPESSFVPETEIINETELYSTTVSYSHFLDTGANFIIQDQDSIPVLESAADSKFNKYSHVLQNNQEILKNNSDANIACVYQEEVGDSVSKSVADAPRGYQLFDECSRVDFMRKFNSLNSPEAVQIIDYVQETWNRMHHECNDLGKYVTEEEKTACQVLKFAHGMTNLISEADLLLKDCQTLVFDSLISSMIPDEKAHIHTYYDNQLEMSSILAQHGMCFYAKEIDSLGSNMESTNRLDLASEMLSSSASSIALGKLTSLEQAKLDFSDARKPISPNILTRKSESCHYDILQSVVPTRSYLAAKGDAFHEYLSTLSHISRFEASRLSECIDKRKLRRGRVARHYLSSGSLSISPEEISLLDRYNSYQKVPSLLRDESFR